MKDNNLSSTTINPNQALIVPSQVYTAKSGDTLYLISKRYNVSLSWMKRANNEWDDYLYIGQKLNTPQTSSESTSSTGQNTYNVNSSYSNTEIDLLARLITAEAESEPYNAKVAVGAVVLNRIKDSRFPNTISSVIYQKSNSYYQFTPVENGWINKPASTDAKKAAQEALKNVDPSNGALYYFDDSSTNKWLWSKPITARIGKMVYVY